MFGLLLLLAKVELSVSNSGFRVENKNATLRMQFSFLCFLVLVNGPYDLVLNFYA